MTLLAGDFNAEPDAAALGLLRDAGRHLLVPRDTPTFPAHDPRRTLDYIAAPSGWTLLD